MFLFLAALRSLDELALVAQCTVRPIVAVVTVRSFEKLVVLKARVREFLFRFRVMQPRKLFVKFRETPLIV